MATLFRDSDGDSREVLIIDQSIDHPAEVQTHAVEQGVPITDHRQRLPRVYTVGIAVSGALGPSGVLDLLDWIEASQNDGLRLLLDDGRETGTLVLGTFTETTTDTAIRVSLDLTERIVVSARTELVTVAPDPAPANAGDDPSTREDGRQGTDEAPESALSSALSWLTGGG